MIDAYRQVLQQASWASVDAINFSDVPIALKNNLCNHDSMTVALRELAEAVSIKVVEQGWGVAKNHEYSALMIQPATPVIIREVLIYGDGKPWMFARTLIPEHFLTDEMRSLAELGDSAIGDVLFKQAGFTRSTIELAQVEAYWLRRSLIGVSQRQVLVTELLLPELLHVILSEGGESRG